jgi:hypothetical protein
VRTSFADFCGPPRAWRAHKDQRVHITGPRRGGTCDRCYRPWRDAGAEQCEGALNRVQVHRTS